MKRIALPLAAIVAIALSSTNTDAARLQIAWQRTNNFVSIDFDGLNTPIIKTDRHGDVYLAGVAGRIEGTRGFWDYVVVKRDASGRLIFQTLLPTSQQAVLKAVEIDNTGNIYVTGSGGTAKFNANGQVAWTVPFADNIDGWKDLQDIGVDSAGNVYVVGHLLADPSSLSSVAITITKYSPDGQWLWMRQPSYGTGRSHLRLDESDHIYVVADARPHPAIDEWAIIKYDTNGNEIWTTRYDGGGFEQVYDIALDRHGDLLITGNDGGHVTLKYSPNGTRLWEAHQPVVGFGATMALDHAGNIYVRDGHYDEETTSHSLLKLDSHGRHQWTIELTSGFGWGRAFAVDKNGYAYVGVKSTILKFDRRGNQLLTIPIPEEASTIDVDRAGRLVVSTPLTTAKIVAR